MRKEQHTEEGKLKKKKEVKTYHIPVPFPQRMQKSRMDDQFTKFLNMFKKIEINISFIETFD